MTGQSSVLVEEASNQQRNLERKVQLPDAGDSGTLYLNASLEAQVQSSYSDAAIRLMVESTDGREEVFHLGNDQRNDGRVVSAAPRVDISEYAGEEVRISIRADGRWTYQWDDTNSWLRVDYVTISQPGTDVTDDDADGDGLPDSLEERGIPIADGSTISTSPDEADTDGDGLDDGAEIDLDNPVYAPLSSGDTTFVGYKMISDPNAPNGDTDSNGLDDSEERDGQQVSVIEDNNGDLVRWDYASETQASRTFTSDPANPNTDGDDLTDAQERDAHTNPRDQSTYSVIDEQQRQIRGLASYPEGMTYAQAMGILDSFESGTTLADIELTDATADFDLVRTDEVGIDRYNFLALMGWPGPTRGSRTDRK